MCVQLVRSLNPCWLPVGVTEDSLLAHRWATKLQRRSMDVCIIQTSMVGASCPLPLLIAAAAALQCDWQSQSSTLSGQTIINCYRRASFVKQAHKLRRAWSPVWPETHVGLSRRMLQQVTGARCVCNWSGH